MCRQTCHFHSLSMVGPLHCFPIVIVVVWCFSMIPYRLFLTRRSVWPLRFVPWLRSTLLCGLFETKKLVAGYGPPGWNDKLPLEEIKLSFTLICLRQSDHFIDKSNMTNIFQTVCLVCAELWKIKCRLVLLDQSLGCAPMFFSLEMCVDFGVQPFT